MLYGPSRVASPLGPPAFVFASQSASPGAPWAQLKAAYIRLAPGIAGQLEYFVFNSGTRIADIAQHDSIFAGPLPARCLKRAHKSPLARFSGLLGSLWGAIKDNSSIGL